MEINARKPVRLFRGDSACFASPMRCAEGVELSNYVNFQNGKRRHENLIYLGTRYDYELVLLFFQALLRLKLL